jgi:hypothetical protein
MAKPNIVISHIYVKYLAFMSLIPISLSAIILVLGYDLKYCAWLFSSVILISYAIIYKLEPGALIYIYGFIVWLAVAFVPILVFNKSNKYRYLVIFQLMFSAVHSLLGIMIILGQIY